MTGEPDRAEATDLPYEPGVLRVFQSKQETKHLPNLMDCRPIYVRRAMEAAGFAIQEAKIDHMWVPVEIVRGIKTA